MILLFVREKEGGEKKKVPFSYIKKQNQREQA